MARSTKSKALGPIQAKVLQALSDKPKFCKTIRAKLGLNQTDNNIRRALKKLVKLGYAEKISIETSKAQGKRQPWVAWRRRERIGTDEVRH